MSAFYPGQPVRIVRAQGLVADLLGREDNIAGPSDLVPGSYKLTRTKHHWHPACLEPILPAGLESIEDVLRLWLPEGEIA